MGEPAVAVNEPAPDFTLPDFAGQAFQLSALKGKKHVLLVFNRGFVWPFCRRHLAQLRQHADEIARRGAEVVVLGPDKASAFEQRWKAEGLPFVGLPDPEHSVLDLYGQQVKLLKLGRMPAQALVDKDGVVRFVHYGSGMSDIPEPAEVLKILDVLNGEPPPVAKT